MNILSCKESRLSIVRETILDRLSSLEKLVNKEIYLNMNTSCTYITYENIWNAQLNIILYYLVFNIYVSIFCEKFSIAQCKLSMIEYGNMKLL